MDKTTTLQLGLEDLLADLRHARRSGDLGRLALIAYCEVRRWARDAGESALADETFHLIVDTPQESRDAFLRRIDALIEALAQLQPMYSAAARVPAAPAVAGRGAAFG